ncbi:Type IV leader peptidase family protein [Streptomyces sp. S4.7]|uniref:prepilin peptidase n=1 Tax=Streptomyces sp. S4.7 TaxID=2705439 RepID=UPI001397AD59|nr:A24 family peptidase [Streptomyces sp. S4.7]QHY97876.1 Type IV leader peptidase family protein [Streptomyces sp. S4.7]
MYATLIVVAVLWGSASGLLLPRAAYRLSVEPEDPYRDSCDAGHPITGPARGWLGTAGCATCAAAGSVVTPADAAGRTDSVTTASPGRAEAGEAALHRTDARTDARPRTDEAATAPGADTATSGADDPADTAGGDPDTGDDADTTSATTAPAPVLRGARHTPSAPVVVITALVCALLAAATGPRPELAVWLLLAPFAVLLALVDRNVHRLPDQLTLPLAAASAALLGIAALFPRDGGSWPTALLGGLVLGACYFVLFLINPNGMGFGDVKLAFSLGVVLGWYGWLVLFVGAFAGFLLGSLYGLGLILLRRANRKSAIPFGPFMIAGALLGVLLGALAA